MLRYDHILLLPNQLLEGLFLLPQRAQVGLLLHRIVEEHEVNSDLKRKTNHPFRKLEILGNCTSNFSIY